MRWYLHMVVEGAQGGHRESDAFSFEGCLKKGQKAWK